MSSNDDNRTVFRPSPLQTFGTGGQAPASRSPLGPPTGTQAPPVAGSGLLHQGVADAWAPPAAGASSAGWGQPEARAIPHPGNDDVPSPSQPQLVRNRLMLEAGPILTLAASIRCGRARAPLAQVHQRATAAIAAFDRAIAGQYPEETRQRAKYAVCSTIDDIVQNLPGSQSEVAEWARHSMVVQTFHENIGGDRFWQLVDDMLARPAQQAELIELYHSCLAAGFEGRFRVMPDGKRRLHEIMMQLYGALEHARSVSNQVLVPHWLGEKAPLRKVGFWNYIGLAAAAAAGLLLAVYLVLLLVLMGTGDGAENALSSLNPAAPLTLARDVPSLAAAPASQQSSRLKKFLEREIAQGLVVVEENASTVRVRTTVGQLFRPASDKLEPGREALFHTIGKALENEAGAITVEGHSDADKIDTLEFPDNIALSGGRANTVALILADEISNTSRVEVQPYGDLRPIASNADAAGKSLNRRVEIVIPRQN